MGKASRWFRALLWAKKSSSDGPQSRPPKDKDKKSKSGPIGIGFGSSNGNGNAHFSVTEVASSQYVDPLDANKHALAVAAATAAVAEAALAAAQAAAQVVRLTSGGNRVTYISSAGARRELAAIKIQSAFRAYLARKALKALRGLVKLQALVRGHIVRKQSTHMLRRMQAMARIQARASARRSNMSDSPHSSSKSNHSHQARGGSKSGMKDNTCTHRTPISTRWFENWTEENSWDSHQDTSLKNGHDDYEKSDKILEIDTWKPQMNFKQVNKAFKNSQDVSAWNHYERIYTPFDTLSRHSTKSHQSNSGPHQDLLSSSSLKIDQEVVQPTVWADANSPGVCSTSSRPGTGGSRRGPFTPTKSECSRSFVSSYTDHPNYMAFTESSRAKVRSQSAPKQRMEFEKSGTTKRFVRGYWDEDTSSERGWPLRGNFGSLAYSGSGRSGKLGAC